MRTACLPCDCNAPQHITRANDLEGATEWMCEGCGLFYPKLQRGETWEPRANETADAHVARTSGYLDRSRLPLA